MNKAEFFQGRLIRCVPHDYKVHQKGAPTHKDCVVCALCRLAHNLETSFFEEDVDDVLKLLGHFKKVTITRIHKAEKDEGYPGTGNQGRRRTRVSRAKKEHDIPKDGDSVGTGPDSVP